MKMYMTNTNFEKFSTKYKEAGTFYILKSHSEFVFRVLQAVNRITLEKDTYNFKKSGIRKDPYDTENCDEIYIRALYYLEGGTAHLLVSNDARRRILELFLKRKENEKFFANFLAYLDLAVAYSFTDRKILKDLFEKVLVKGKYLAAGSFPLQVYLNERYVNSDLDIFTTHHEATDFLMQQQGVKFKLLTPDMKANRDDYTFSFDFQVSEFTLLGSGFRIQIIEPPYRNVEKAIEDFDFDFCKIYWDFLNAELVILNKTAVVTKSCDYDLSRKVHYNCDKRLQKYQDRGFTVRNAEKMLALKEIKR
jgi:hypothetical protein